MTTEKFDQPVVGKLWHIREGHFLQEGRMSYCVESLAEVQWDDSDVWLSEEHVDDGIEEGDDCRCSRACRAEYKLVGGW